MPEVGKEGAASEEWMILRENHQYDFSLAAQERDREAERAHFRQSQKSGLLLMAGADVFLLVLVIAAFCMGKESFLLDCLRYLIVGGGGGGIGYAFGARRDRRK